MRKKIGELLVESGAVTEAKVRNALGHQKAHAHGDRLGRILVSMGLVSPAAVARALATQFDLPFIELPEVPSRLISRPSTAWSPSAWRWRGAARSSTSRWRTRAT